MPVLDATQPFTHAEARSAGVNDRALRGAAFRKVFSNVYIDASIPDTLVVRCRAALKILPSDTVFSHATASRLWSGVSTQDPNVHVSFARPVSCAVDGIKVHRFLRPFATGKRHGLPVTTPEQTVLHLARPLDLVDLVVCADQMVRRGVTTPFDLAEFLRQNGGQGGRLAQRAAQLVRDRVDAPSETRLRLLMVLAGLPEPVANHVVVRPDGSVLYRLDLAFPDHLLAIEYDGRWHDDPEQQVLDDARRQDLASRGWRVVVLRAEDLYDDPEETLHRLHAELRARGIPAPNELSDRWRLHFATRGLVA
jgi:hypothetical protein